MTKAEVMLMDSYGRLAEVKAAIPAIEREIAIARLNLTDDDSLSRNEQARDFAWQSESRQLPIGAC